LEKSSEPKDGWSPDEEKAMRNLMLDFWRDERGFVPAPEWALVATILVLGAITGMVAARQAAFTDTADVPAAITR
jgi:Flp pilus assembly pilin Flp